MSINRTLEEVLQSTSEVLFPAELGKQTVEVNSRDADGDTPLHIVAWRCDCEAARLLLAAGADVNARGDMGETPLHVARRRGCMELVAVLLAAGAREDVQSEFGKTP